MGDPLIVVPIVFLDAENRVAMVDIVTESTFDPRCDVCKYNLEYVRNALNQMHKTAVFHSTDCPYDGSLVKVKLPESNKAAFFDWFRTAFADTITNAHIASIDWA